MQAPIGSAAERDVVEIADDSGGQILEYAAQYFGMSERRTKARFAGRCDCACAIFPGRPRSCVCLTRDACFRFRALYGASEQGVAVARAFMTRQYPRGMRDWIAAQGGPGRELRFTDHSYARRHPPSCENRQAARSTAPERMRDPA